MDAVIAAEIIAADVMSFHWEPTQSLGGILSGALPELFNQSAFEGFSNHSAEACHEHTNGEGTCPYIKARDDACTGCAQN